MNKETARRLLETLKSLENENKSSEEKMDEAKKEFFEHLTGEDKIDASSVLEKTEKVTVALAEAAFNAGVEEGFLTCLDILREGEMGGENAASA